MHFVHIKNNHTVVTDIDDNQNHDNNNNHNHNHNYHNSNDNNSRLQEQINEIRLEQRVNRLATEMVRDSGRAVQRFNRAINRRSPYL